VAVLIVASRTLNPTFNSRHAMLATVGHRQVWIGETGTAEPCSSRSCSGLQPYFAATSLLFKLKVYAV